MRHLESQEQINLVWWSKTQPIENTSFFVKDFLYSIPNGGKLAGTSKQAKITGSRLKAEGLTAGIPDLFLSYPVRNYHGLYIEMKRPKTKGGTKGYLSKEQKVILLRLKSVDYAISVCYGYEQAKEVVLKYLNGESIEQNF